MAKTSKSDSHEVWDLRELLGNKNFDQWISEIKRDVETFKGYRKILNDKITPAKLLEIVKTSESIAVKYSRLESYYTMRFYEDTTNQEATAKIGVIKQFAAEVSNDTLFFSLWLINLDDKVAAKLINAPELRPYRYNLESARKSKPYTKSEEIEQIIQIKDITSGSAFYDIYCIITSGFTFDWYGKIIGKEELTNFYRNGNPEYRKRSYDLMLGRYGENSQVLGELYKNIVVDWYNDGIKIRGYANSIAVANLSYDVSGKAIDTLLKTIRKNVGIFIEYFKVKYALNKKSGQKYPYSRYHLYAPFNVKTEIHTYQESKKYVLETLKKFDVRFYDRAVKIFEKRHVHSPPLKNKRGGAFCHSVTRGITPYILLNHTNRLKDMFTMIHEFGHGVHDMLAAEKQTDFERQASMTVCEIASVFGEMILADRMLREGTNADEKKSILVELLDNQWATVIRQAYFAIFEVYAHEAIQKGATKDELDAQYYALLKEQFGDMEIPEIFKHEWNYIPHIHEYPFYCYSYAWGNLSVLALYDIYRKEGKKFVDKYVEFLSAGGSESPANLLKKFGIDVESEDFWQRGFEVIREEIAELKRLSK